MLPAAGRMVAGRKVRMYRSRSQVDDGHSRGLPVASGSRRIFASTCAVAVIVHRRLGRRDLGCGGVAPDLFRAMSRRSRERAQAR
jgi:hypothetical protein